MYSSLSFVAILFSIFYIALLVSYIIFIVKQWMTMNRITEILDEVRDIRVFCYRHVGREQAVA